MQSRSTTLHCFTPLVSLATFFIEFMLAVYVFLRFKTSLFQKIIITLLLFLGIFQLAEYQLCKAGANEAVGIFWIKLAYIVITFLPPLGLHLITIITKKGKKSLFLAYTGATFLTLLMLMSSTTTLRAVCLNYRVDFYTHPLFTFFHAFYYFVIIVFTLRLININFGKNHTDRVLEKWMIASYLVFIFPSALFFILGITSRFGLPSVMCGFAILTAMILAFKVMPRYEKISKK